MEYISLEVLTALDTDHVLSLLINQFIIFRHTSCTVARNVQTRVPGYNCVAVI